MAKRAGEQQPETSAVDENADAVRELAWVLRRMMYVFISWAEKKYGWKRAQHDE